MEAEGVSPSATAEADLWSGMAGTAGLVTTEPHPVPVRLVFKIMGQLCFEGWYYLFTGPFPWNIILLVFPKQKIENPPLVYHINHDGSHSNEAWSID